MKPITLAAGALALALAQIAHATPPDDEEEPTAAPRPALDPAPAAQPAPATPAPAAEFSFDAIDVEGALVQPSGASLGATPGGAQDANYGRDVVARRKVPRPGTITPEGLFSSHDLPLPSAEPCKTVLCLNGAAAGVDLLAQPDARVLAQVGFSSGLDPKTWKRPSLTVVAVVDRSGSMRGRPLSTARAGLHALIDALDDEDRMALVAFGNSSRTLLGVTPVRDKAALHRMVDGLRAGGSTAMARGLAHGYDLAKASMGDGQSTDLTRVMLFTDERPNVGRTDAGSFMHEARQGAEAGVGLTTFGVGRHFGAHLAQTVSAVRGANLFYARNEGAMRSIVEDKLDTLVVPLAHRFILEMKPARGWRIAGLYGLPGDLVRSTPEGGLVLEIETLFLSRSRGGIFFALAPKAGVPDVGHALASGQSVAMARLRYLTPEHEEVQDELRFAPIPEKGLPLGLARGRVLVDMATSIEVISQKVHQQHQLDAAFRMARSLHQRMQGSGVPGLEQEVKLVSRLRKTIAQLTGRPPQGRTLKGRDPVSGLPRGGAWRQVEH